MVVTQKGTLGMAWPQVDFPFDSQGTSPDILMNSLALPSRMTIAMLLEALTGKKVAAGSLLAQTGIHDFFGTSGSIKKIKRSPMDTNSKEIIQYSNFKNDTDATPFRKCSLTAIQAEIRKMGYDCNGDCQLYDGPTGKPLKALVFKGLAYYQRLKHMVEDKVHCLTPDHEVLTDRGWIDITNVTKQDRVCTLKNGKATFDHPIEILHYPHYCGKIYTVSTKYINLRVTEEHRMWVSRDGGKTYGLKKVCDICTIDTLYYVNGSLKPLVSAQNYHIEYYEGAVYCLQVPSEVFYVRRKVLEGEEGLPVWTGNSRAKGGKAAISRQPLEGFVPTFFPTCAHFLWAQLI